MTLGLLGQAGCQDDAEATSETSGTSVTSSNGSDAAVGIRAVLASISQHVIVPSHQSFLDDATGLKLASTNLASAALTDPSGAAVPQLDVAQASWRRAFAAWQRVEVMQIGPAASSIDAVAGENLRDAVYSWPTVNSCSVDRTLVDGSFAAPDFLAVALPYAYGLDALEHLLFHTPISHTCPRQIQLDDAWNALGEVEIRRRRAQYAAVLATAIEQKASELVHRWVHQTPSFANYLAAPGTAGSPYVSDEIAANEVFRAMFYLDLVAKDAKLGRALGLGEGGCVAVPCVELLESAASGQGAQALHSNLLALRELVTGGSDPLVGVGFDDLLHQLGHGTVAADLLRDIDGAVTLVDGLVQGKRPLQELIVSERPRVDELYAAIKRITDTLKGPFVMILRLKVPSEGAGDND